MSKAKIIIKKLIYVILSTILLGIGIATYRVSGLGNDAYSALNFSLVELTGFSYTICTVIINLVLAIPMLIWERKRINIGTFINIVFTGLVVDLVLMIYEKIGFNVETYNMLLRYAVAILGLFVDVFGLSLFLTADFGLTPYDCVPLVLVKKANFSFRTSRWIADGSCLIIAFLVSNLLLKKHAVGMFTLITFFMISPLLTHFNKVLAGEYKEKRRLKREEKMKNEVTQ